MVTVLTPLADVVGGRTAKPFAEGFDIHTVGDLLRHYPRRMAERGELTDLASLKVDDDVTVLAEVRSCRTVFNRGKGGSRLEVVVGDGRGSLKLTFFGRAHAWRERELAVGTRGLFAGKVGMFRESRQLVNPEYQLLPAAEDEAPNGQQDIAAQFAGRLIPVYPATVKLRSWTIAKTIEVVLGTLGDLPDPIPEDVRSRHRLMDFRRAIEQIHRPADRSEWSAARARLKWDEAFGVQLALAHRRALADLNAATPRPARSDGLAAAFELRLPFELTDGQLEVGQVLADELAGTQPMRRLLQGEVGSGKTIVALRAMLQVIDAGGQAALLAPTEVLAAQHARSIEAMLGDLAQDGLLGGADQATTVRLLTGSMPTRVRRESLLDAASGRAGIVVGTHALIQDHVQFADLGLVVVDEQHRFGVEQRDALRVKAERPPHMLAMTATPIPRTVAMTVFGDLETSILAELPKGRRPIATSVVGLAEHPQWMSRVWERVGEEVTAGRQAFVVCPRIGDEAPPDAAHPAKSARGVTRKFALYDADLVEDEIEDEIDEGQRRVAAALDVFADLRNETLPKTRVGLLHGRLGSEEKDTAMAAFTSGQTEVLVTTTVIEVGVDVPNASVMVILDADRFGVSQLHQLRGRVGRGGFDGLCLLVSSAPPASEAMVRLNAVASTTDGFELAELDLEQRREGDVLGAAQSGRRSQLKLLSLLRDVDVITAARAEAAALVAGDPVTGKGSGLTDHPALLEWVSSLLTQDRVDYLEKS